MCLSTVKRITGSTEEILAEYVSSIRCSGNSITMKDIMGEERVASGQIQNIDLINNIIFIGE